MTNVQVTEEFAPFGARRWDCAFTPLGEGWISRSHGSDRPGIVIGLLVAGNGVSIAHDVFLRDLSAYG
jgi:hypothetical protein